MVLLLAACASTGKTGQSTGNDELGALIGRETDAQATVNLTPGPEASTFIGREVRALDQLLGAPSLIRQEGMNEFRRYDLETCRVYAVVTPAGGLVETLTTGPLVAGRNAPSFPRCTAGL